MRLLHTLKSFFKAKDEYEKDLEILAEDNRIECSNCHNPPEENEELCQGMCAECFNKKWSKKLKWYK